MANHLHSSVPFHHDHGMIYLSGRYDKCQKFKSRDFRVNTMEIYINSFTKPRIVSNEITPYSSMQCSGLSRA